ncbi:uncharacterized protein LOC116207119 [Punica granatum]|nr:uncharacterized protein LOC116207119 [Punica granatum]PKI63690.1 hypothetical protein CRG98_015939 [Punica granatum]
MASAVIDTKLCFCIAVLCLVSVFCCGLGNAEGDVPQFGEEGGVHEPGTGEEGEFSDPSQIVAKALLCFNDKYIYKSCEESYRLDQSGDLHVPPEHTLEYCTGPCLRETNLVLDCIDGVLIHFLFYNRATIKDVRDTIHAGCSYGPERGHFDVAEHIAAEEAGARRVASQILIQLGLIFAGRLLFLGHV